ncbi:MAG TPA: CBS domain-containing protein [Anaerolineae bacterium]|nr:CBS domain-containing protein [Anaerolineae bacterium]
MLKARDIMTSRVVTIQSLATVADALELMRKHQVHALVVDRSGPEDAYGLIVDEDIVYNVIAEGEDPAVVQVYEVMTKPCVVVNPDLSVEYVAKLFANVGIRCAPVIQEKLLGIISVSDILHKSG